MSTTNHTAEPWEARSNDICPVYTHGSLCNGGIRLATVRGIHPEGLANADRIVTCVNACAGMEDPTASIPQARAALNAAWLILFNGGSASSQVRALDQIESSLTALGG